MSENDQKKSDKNYFGIETEIAIIEFQKEQSQEKKEAIFNNVIKPSFQKLIENIIFVYKFHSLDDLDILKNDCMSHLFGVLHKFDENRKKKAFSYFNVIAKNWFIQQTKLNKKRLRLDVSIDRDSLAELECSERNFVVQPREAEMIEAEFLELLKNNLEEWKKKFYKDSERKVVDAVSLILENPDSVSLYNKKATYVYLRELTGLSTKQIAANLVKLRKKYEAFKQRYENGDI